MESVQRRMKMEINQEWPIVISIIPLPVSVLAKFLSVGLSQISRVLFTQFVTDLPSCWPS